MALRRQKATKPLFSQRMAYYTVRVASNRFFEREIMKLSRIVYAVVTIVCNIMPVLQAAPERSQDTISSVHFKKLYTLKGHKDIVQSMKMLHNGLLVSGSADATMRLWDMDGTCRTCLRNNSDWINTVEELSDGRIACGSNEGIVTLWNGANGTCTTLLNLEHEHVYGNSVIQLACGNLAFNTRKRTIKMWDLGNDMCLKTIDTEQHKAWISSLIELKNLEYLVSASWDKTIKIWDVSQDKSICIATLTGHTDCINSVCQLDDHRFVSGADDKTIMIWDLDSNEKPTTLLGHNDRVYTLIVAHEKIISGSRDKTVKIWDQDSGNCLATISCQDKIYSLAFSPENHYLFVGLGCGDIEVFSLELGA
jgi:WD40 repeat protein